MVFPNASALVSKTSNTEFPIDSGDLIAGVGRALAVIEAFNDEYRRMTVSQVAERTGIPRTAARRYLLNLCHFGYGDTDGKFYGLTPRVLRLGQSYLDGARLPRLVQPFIQRLAMSSGETVNVSVLDGHKLVYIAQQQPTRGVNWLLRRRTRASPFGGPRPGNFVNTERRRFESVDCRPRVLHLKQQCGADV
jgi:IclR family transcriptional regulator, pca regulon regulatory protein